MPCAVARSSFSSLRVFMNSTRKVSVVAALAVVIIAGCGDSPGETTTVTEQTLNEGGGGPSVVQLAACLRSSGFEAVRKSKQPEGVSGTSTSGSSIFVILAGNSSLADFMIKRFSKRGPVSGEPAHAEVADDDSTVVITDPPNGAAQASALACANAGDEGLGGRGSTNNTVDEQSSGGESSGDGGASPPQSAEGPTPEEFIAKADAICAELNTQGGDPPTDTIEQVKAAAERSEQLVEDGLGRLRALEVPSEMKIEFDQFLAAVEDQLAVTRQLKDAAAAGDVEAVQALGNELQQAADRKSDIAINAGFAECGSST